MMEPPMKRPRIAREHLQNRPKDQGLLPFDTNSLIHDDNNNNMKDVPSLPTRTINLSDFRRRSLLDSPNKPPSALQNRNAGIYLFPRAPDATVTANVVEIAVNDGSDSRETTEIAVPSSHTEVAIASFGTLTVSAAGSTLSAVSSVLPGLTQTPLSSHDSSSHTSSSSSSSSASSISFPSVAANGTVTSSAGDSRTVTVTITSTFHVSYSNGTFAPATTSASRSNSTRSHATATATSDTETSSASSTSSYDSPSSSSEDHSVTSTESAGYGASHSITDGSNNLLASVAASNSPTQSAQSTSSSAPIGPTLTPQQTQVVGGVVGGIAGVALVLVIILYVLRWYRQHLKGQGRLPSPTRSFPSDDPGVRCVTALATSEKSRSSLLPVTALASNLKKWRPHSGYMVASSTSGTLSLPGNGFERGFQRIAGRKIPSVLAAGGDGYGGTYGAFDREVVSPPCGEVTFGASIDTRASALSRSASNLRDNYCRPASISEPNTPTLTSFLDPQTGRLRDMSCGPPSFSTLGTVNTRDFTSLDDTDSHDDLHNVTTAVVSHARKPEGYAMMRSSPARTPVTQSPSSSTFRLPFQAPITMEDGVPALPLPPSSLAYGRLGTGLAAGKPSSVAVERTNSRVSSRSTASSTAELKEVEP